MNKREPRVKLSECEESVPTCAQDAPDSCSKTLYSNQSRDRFTIPSFTNPFNICMKVFTTFRSIPGFTLNV